MHEIIISLIFKVSISTAEKHRSDTSKKIPLCPRHRGVLAYTIQYDLKLFRLTPIDLCHFRDRLCYISRKPLLPIRHQITQEPVLKLHPIEIPKTLVDFQPFRNGSFSQNIRKLMKKLIFLRRRGLDSSIGIQPLPHPKSLVSYGHLLC